ncbi:hypothetical protein FPG87_12590 [Flavobacterium psychrophilum]|nr:hypothetical protein FPG87_12590 [Flavobacterium psychrophilum]
MLVAAVVVRCYESALNFLEVFFAFSSKVSDSISEVFSQHFFAFSSVHISNFSLSQFGSDFQVLKSQK